MHAGLAGGDRRMRLEIGRIGMGARIRERQQRALALVGALVADRLIFVSSRLNETVPLRVRTPGGGDAHRAAGSQPLPTRPRTGRRDPTGGDRKEVVMRK